MIKLLIFMALAHAADLPPVPNVVGDWTCQSRGYNVGSLPIVATGARSFALGRENLNRNIQSAVSVGAIDCDETGIAQATCGVAEITVSSDFAGIRSLLVLSEYGPHHLKISYTRWLNYFGMFWAWDPGAKYDLDCFD